MRNKIRFFLGFCALWVLGACAQIESTHYYRADGTRDIEESIIFLEGGIKKIMPEEVGETIFLKEEGLVLEEGKKKGAFYDIPEDEWVNIGDVEDYKNIKNEKIFIKVIRNEKGEVRNLFIKGKGLFEKEMKVLEKNEVIAEKVGRWNGKKLVIKDLFVIHKSCYGDKKEFVSYTLKFENRIKQINHKNSFISQIDEHTVKIYVAEDDANQFEKEMKKNKIIIITE